LPRYEIYTGKQDGSTNEISDVIGLLSGDRKPREVKVTLRPTIGQAVLFAVEPQAVTVFTIWAALSDERTGLSFTVDIVSSTCHLYDFYIVRQLSVQVLTETMHMLPRVEAGSHTSTIAL
jgi:hypothetical protein